MPSGAISTTDTTTACARILLSGTNSQLAHKGWKSCSDVVKGVWQSAAYLNWNR